MKKLFYVVLFILFIVPSSCFAYSDGEVTDYFMSFDIQSNGDIKVYELAHLTGDYNGRYRNYSASNSYKAFTGVKDDFNSSIIYNADSIDDVEIYQYKKDNITYDDLLKLKNGNNSLLNKYYENDYCNSNGCFIKSGDSSSKLDFKIYMSDSLKSSSYITYTIKNAVVKHNDVAEFAWNIFDKGFDDSINNLEARIYLPDGYINYDKSLVFLRGPLNGNIYLINKEYADITYDHVNSNNAVSFRIVFDNNLVPLSSKYSGVDGKNMILAVEKDAADEANRIRKRSHALFIIINILFTIFGIIVIYLFIFLKKKVKKSMESSFDMDYYREIPRDFGPEICEYLMNHNIDNKGFSASLLNIIDKGALVQNMDIDNTLTKNEAKYDLLTDNEKIVYDLIINEIGDSNKVTLKQIKKYAGSSLTYSEFLSKYNKWRRDSIKYGSSLNFFKCFQKEQVIAIIIAILNIPLFFLFMFINLTGVFNIINYIYIIGILFISLCLFFYAWSLKFYTDEGATLYKEFNAFKKFLEDFGEMDTKELPELKLWNKYLVYAIVLGCAKKLAKDMKIKAAEIADNAELANYYGYNNYNNNYFFFDSDGSDSFVNTVSDSISDSFTSAYSNYSSSSGGGGGASSGGGSFGGGSGGGHF